MQTRATLRPGQKGTRSLLQRYGDRLICVRYRYDPETHRRIKTAEIVVDEQPWVYSPSYDSPNARPVTLAIAYEEHDLRARIKRAGGRWDPDRRLWSMQLGMARQLGLTERIVSEASRSGNQDRKPDLSKNNAGF